MELNESYRSSVNSKACGPQALDENLDTHIDFDPKDFEDTYTEPGKKPDNFLRIGDTVYITRKITDLQETPPRQRKIFVASEGISERTISVQKLDDNARNSRF
jgi:hypothetical protein